VIANEIRYFSMFTGVGGFELGIERTTTRSFRNAEYSSEEENLSNSEGNKSISERQQKETNYSTDNRQIESTEDASGTLLQNRQLKSNSISADLGVLEDNIKFGQQIRQTSNGILREGNGIRDDEESMEFREDSTNIKQFQCVGFSEIDKYASQLLANKFPNVKNYGDARKIIPAELPDFELLVGGFPCQAFSIAGKRKGFEDTRGTLFHEIVRIVEVKRPKYFLLENVKGLLSHDNGRTFGIILTSLSKLGYVIQWMVLNSKFFGVPQNRERVFIIGSLRGEPIPEILPFGESSQEFDNQNGQGNETAYCLQQGDKHRGSYINELNQIAQVGEKDNMGQRVYDTEGIATSVRSQGGGQGAKTGLYAVDEKTRDVSKAIEVAQQISNETGKAVQLDLLHLQHGEIRPLSTYIPQNLDEHRCLQAGEPKEVLIEGMKIRRLTPIECERLQGFPDGWTSEGINEKGEIVKMSDTQRYKMCGNAVTTNVISAIINKWFNKN